MSRIISSGEGIDVNAIADGTLDAEIAGVTFVKTAKPVGAATYVELAIHHHAFVAQIGEVKYTVPEATQPINAGVVATATTYYCYYQLQSGVMTWVATLTHPDLATPEEEDYVWVREVRFSAPDADVAKCLIEFVVRHTCTHDEFCHELSDAIYLQPPLYVSGFGITVSATGQISTAEGHYSRLVGGVRTRTAITNGVIFSPGGAETVANLEAITHYGDGSGDITADKWVKVLVGLVANDASDYDFIINVQGKPGTEYTSAAEAWTDALDKAATGFSSLRRGSLLPLMWIVFQKGECAAAEIRDIREMGMVTASGASAGVTSHSALSNLDVLADHQLYLAVDGSRELTGDMTVTAGKKIDGVDISAHAADTEAHHATVTLAATADVLLGLTGQEVSLDTQAAKKVLAGPVSGAAAAPTFRQLAAADISDFDAAALLAAPAVTLSGSAATGLMDLTGQAISLDTQSASTVLAGPVVGASAAAPTFRQLNIQDIARPSGTLTLVNGANNNVALTAGTRVYSIAGPTGAFSITGFTGGTDGAVLYIYNPLSQNMTLTSESANSDAANRIVLGSNVATNNVGAVTLFYIAGTVNRWIASGLIA